MGRGDCPGMCTPSEARLSSGEDTPCRRTASRPEGPRGAGRVERGMERSCQAEEEEAAEEDDQGEVEVRGSRQDWQIRS